MIQTKLDEREDRLAGLGWPIVEDPRLLVRYPCVVWRPPLYAVRHWREDWRYPWSLGLWWIWTVRAQGGCLVYLDEAKQVAPVKPHPLIADMVTQGMGRGLGVWWSGQGPFGVFSQLVSDAVDLLLFRLGTNRHRSELAANIDVEVSEDLKRQLARLEQGQFYHYRSGLTAITGPHKLRLSDLKK